MDDTNRSDSLVELPRESWAQVMGSFQAWWPHGVTGYYVLLTFIEHPDMAEKFFFRVFCPFGDIKNGAVAFCDKGSLKEVILLTNSKDNSKIEEAVATSKRINWEDAIICIPYADSDVITILRNLSSRIGLRMIHQTATIKHFLDKNTKPFENVTYPDNTYVDELKLENINQIDNVWPHRYEASPRLFEVIIRNHRSYGLFSSEDHSLLAWVVINEVGFLTHLYVEEKHRKKGLAEFLIKYVSNDQLSKGKDVFCYIVEYNLSSLKLFRKLNYEIIGRGVWSFVSTNAELNMSSVNG